MHGRTEGAQAGQLASEQKRRGGGMRVNLFILVTGVSEGEREERWSFAATDI